MLEFVAMLPAWAGIAIAAITYFWLHSIASQPAPAAPVQPAQMGAYVTSTLWKTLAYYGQFFIPLICLGGAALSAWRRKQREALLVNAAKSEAASALDDISWQEFEMLVGEAFRRQGYQVMENGGSRPDGGIDLILRKEDELFLVQCKQWKAFRVGVDVVRELYGVMAAKGAAGGYVVTSGLFTEAAMRFAKGRNLKLIDGRVLMGWIRQVKPIQKAIATSKVANESALTPELDTKAAIQNL
ncbi:restriction endonuclease [Paucimonas lemoignei]|uniref:restriction endonuclease n=1 Tax=Paucimonas lemoignei TaxID=29443 RepID=UPI001405214E|nr:restriction endonuclease [Paucimonas lemoignei]